MVEENRGLTEERLGRMVERLRSCGALFLVLQVEDSTSEV